MWDLSDACDEEQEVGLHGLHGESWDEEEDEEEDKDSDSKSILWERERERIRVLWFYKLIEKRVTLKRDRELESCDSIN